MCGITGFYSTSFTEDQLTQMTQTLQHRGPDAAGYFFKQDIGIGLGHRRLSILDLSTAANQPFYSHDGRYVMVYNGEVYNYREIRAKLPHRNWKTDGDTEVILEAFAAWGADFVQELNGMFAIAIFDQQTQQLHLFRDRLGIKPLYYFQEGTTFAFASELKTLKKLIPNLAINQAAISHFLYLGYVPETATFYQNIYKFPAGSVGKYQPSQLELSAYWEIDQQFDSTTLKDEQQAKIQLKDLLFSAIEQRMISDVPLGTFLSGGIDSSTVTAIAQQVSTKPVKSFSIGFKENKFNESRHAAQVAKYLGTDHHEFIVSEKEAIVLFDELLQMHDQPFADSSAIPTYLVSKMARQEVTVTLSGDGGDELFMGYGMYHWAQRLQHPLVKIGHRQIAWLLKTSGKNRLQRAATVFNYTNPQRIKSHIFSQEQYLFSEQELKDLLKPSYPSTIYFNENTDIANRKLSAQEAQALFDLKHYLKDDLLVKVDIATMQNSLESRVPLLDHRIVEFAMNLDAKLKVKNGVQKYLLKQVLYDFVPKSYFDRPKWGFSIPLINWLQRELKYLIDDYLSQHLVEEIGVVNWLKVENLKKRFFAGEYYLYNRLWVLILLHKWFKN